MGYEYIRYEVSQGVAHLTLNRPDKLNSFIAPMSKELALALKAAEQDQTVRALLLTGAGRGFCAGQDLSEFAPVGGAKPKIPDLGGIIAECYNPVVKAIRSIEKPVVCAVNGVAAGAGANLAFACDLTLAAKEASFIQSFSKVGLISDCGGSFFLPRLVGMARATALTMLAEKVSAEQAQQLGLIYRVVEGSELMTEATKLAVQLATQPTRGFGLMKRGLNASLSNSLEEQLELERELQSLAGKSEDFIEGVSAFFEKRAPVFTGK
jgi:2-(1,2-epoxy-1,2-dihydrophenyl)acetyl-CoA isomerase